MPAKETLETWSWAPELNTGVAVVDDERQQLLRLTYQAHILAEQGASTSQLLQQARDLIVCSASYFRREADIIQVVDHPALEATLAAQGKVMQSLQQDFNSRAFNKESIAGFILFLKDCLVTHIKAADNNFSAPDKTLDSKIKEALSCADALSAINTVDIYIVDDEQQHVDLMVDMISIAGLSATGFTSAKLFIDQPITNTDIILLDLNMPDMDGIEVMRTLYDKGCMPTYILVSGFDERVLHSAKQFADAKNILVAKKLSKPINTKEFIHYISQLYIEIKVA